MTDEVGVVEYLGLMARDNHQFAKFNKIEFDQHGDPVPTTSTWLGPPALESSS